MLRQSSGMILRRLEHAKRISAPEFIDVGFAVARGKKPLRDLWQAGDIHKPVHSAPTIIVAAESDMIGTNHLQCMEHVSHVLIEARPRQRVPALQIRSPGKIGGKPFGSIDS